MNVKHVSSTRVTSWLCCGSATARGPLKALWALLCVVVVLGAAEVLLRMMSRGMPALVDPASVAVLGERHLIAAGDSRLARSDR